MATLIILHVLYLAMVAIPSQTVIRDRDSHNSNNSKLHKVVEILVMEIIHDIISVIMLLLQKPKSLHTLQQHLFLRCLQLLNASASAMTQMVIFLTHNQSIQFQPTWTLSFTKIPKVSSLLLRQDPIGHIMSPKMTFKSPRLHLLQNLSFTVTLIWFPKLSPLFVRLTTKNKVDFLSNTIRLWRNS
jgi:hypothetical protein